MGCSASSMHTKHHYTTEEDPPSSSSFDYSTATYSTATNSLYSSPKVIHRATSLQTPLVHHPPSRKGDTHHLVSLTSTTYGSLDYQSPNLKNPKLKKTLDFSDSFQFSPQAESYVIVKGDSFENLSPDSVINTWELMDGLDEFDFERGLGKLGKSVSFDSNPPIEFSAKGSSFGSPDGFLKKPLIAIEDSPSKSKPLWKHLSEESFLSNLDPNVVSSYRHALSSRLLGSDKSRSSRSLGCSPMHSSTSWLRSPCTDNRIVLYFTSLRGIRKTYEDCCEVRMIFRGFRVPVDERDISMDFTYRKELQSLLGVKAISLPQVFIRGKHVGGVEEIKQFNEIGELGKLLLGFPVRDPRIVCEHCGDARFVSCPNCNGSRKIFEEEEGRMRRCLDCNENGLLRCPGCCS